jgi:hypothetical protein
MSVPLQGLLRNLATTSIRRRLLAPKGLEAATKFLNGSTRTRTHARPHYISQPPPQTVRSDDRKDARRRLAMASAETAAATRPSRCARAARRSLIVAMGGEAVSRAPSCAHTTSPEQAAAALAPPS